MNKQKAKTEKNCVLFVSAKYNKNQLTYTLTRRIGFGIVLTYKHLEVQGINSTSKT